MAIVIFADALEKDIIDILKTYDCHVVEKKLEVADFIPFENIGVERKRDEDFVQSIIDGRLFEQMRNLRECFEKPLLVIEGNNLYGSNVHENAIRGAMASVALDYTVPIIWTNNKKETAALLFLIAKREQEGKKRIFTVKGKRKPLSDKEYQEYIISSLPGIGPLTAKELLKEFKSVEKVCTANEGDLQGVNKIGKKKARQIREIMTKHYEDR
jgi:Fanconi anemia group M protein